ncbi:hypothetical protein [Vreelandella venusta]|uniref:hypothetical protein n=1 Tax=Vreelandella venusta TaxID=44935 RepID=UPI00116A36A9|nr:hypothetical protein [Halomonas venusta]GEK52328.1 hypothetical protein HVE01_30490 [Halomonas venusta]
MSFEQAVASLEQTNATLVQEVVRVRDAGMGLNNIYPTVNEGRAATVDGKYFSVPGNGAYMRLYRRQGSSAELIAEFPDRAELNSVIDQLGPLLGRGVVGGGTNDLMAVGAFGLGSNGRKEGVNWDDPGVGGFYSVSGAEELGPLSDGFLGQSSGSTMYHGLWDGNNWSKILVDGGGAPSSRPPQIYVKASNFGTRKKAVRLVHNANILGAVTQVDGVPTGAIIEQGSNANGEYFKFAGGAVIAFGKSLLDVALTLESGNLYTSPSNISLPLPVLAEWTFVDVQKISNAGSLIPVFGATVFGVSSGNDIRFRPLSTQSIPLTGIPFSFFAIGRW